MNLLVAAIIALLGFFVLQRVFKKTPPNLVPLSPFQTFFPSLQLFPFDPKEATRFFDESSKKCGSLFRMELLLRTAVFATDPESINDIFSKMKNEFPNRPVFGALPNRDLLIAKGLLRLKDEEWQHTRRLGTITHALIMTVTPLFGWSVMTNIFGEFVDKTSALINVFQLKMKAEKLDKLEISCRTEMGKITSDVICKVAFGYDLNGVNNDQNPVGKALDVIFQPDLLFFLIPYWHLVPLETNRQKMNGMKLLKDLVFKIITERRARKGKVTENRDFLQILIDEGADLSNEDLFDECMTMFIAGHETTSTLLGWLYYEVGQNPKIQQNIHEEIDQVLQGKPITAENVKDLKYLSACVDESLRLHPAAAFIAREANQDVNYKGYTIQKGTMVVAHLWHLHRNPEYYKDPMKFDPERFLGEKTPGLEYIPFGTGPHICVGKRMAITEAKAIAATIFQHFRMETNMNHTFEERINFLHIPSKDMRVYLFPREK